MTRVLYYVCPEHLKTDMGKKSVYIKTSDTEFDFSDTFIMDLNQVFWFGNEELQVDYFLFLGITQA